MVTDDILILHFQKVRSSVGQEASGDQRPSVGGARSKPLDRPRQLFLLPFHQRKVVSVLPLLDDIVCCFSTGQIFVSVLDLWCIFVWQPIGSDEIYFLIAELPKA